MAHWLFKTEPGCFSIDHLAALPDQTSPWDGVRNYQARNMMRDDMKPGDTGLFYHSSIKEPAVVGVVTIVRAGYPDHTAWDPENQHYDPASTPEKPRWYMVDVKLVKRLQTPLTRTMLATVPELAGMELLRRGSRLSVQPVTDAEFAIISRLMEHLA